MRQQVTAAELRKLGLTAWQGNWAKLKATGIPIAGAGYGEEEVLVTIPQGQQATSQQLRAARRYIEDYLTRAAARE